MTRHHLRRRDRRRRVVILVTLAIMAVGLTPLPFNVVFADEPVATVWRLDGRLNVNGRTANPEGRWSFVAIGRPELVGEALIKRARHVDRPVRNVRFGLHTQRPIVAEPLAAAAGLKRAGLPLTAQPVLLVQDLAMPSSVLTVIAINGSETLLAELLPQLAHTPADLLFTDTMTFLTIGGEELQFSADERITRRFSASELLDENIEAQIRWRTQGYVPQAWFRSLAVGNSHGLMVALVTYAAHADRDVAKGLHVSGTGAIRTDGTVLPIGGVTAKAKAAHRAGADVFFYPAVHAAEVTQLTLPRLELVPVLTLDEAIDWLHTYQQQH